MAPGYNLVVLVQASCYVLVGNTVIEGMMNVIFPRPYDFDWRTVHRLGKNCRFERKVTFRLASETATQQGHVHPDVFFLHAKGFGYVAAGTAGALHAGPDFSFAILDLDRGRWWLHRYMH